MAKDLRGKPVADALTAQLADRVLALKEQGVAPKLAILRVGERADDLSYERGALKRCASVGIEVETIALPADCTQDELMASIERINNDDSIHGCLMFRPLPKTLDEGEACAALVCEKDMDCVTAGSLYGVFTVRPVGFAPCTAEAVIELLDFYGYDLTGARVTIIGRSLVIGKPLSMMLQAKNATITVCHRKTRDLPSECKRADFLVVAVGEAGCVGADSVKEGQVVLDVGINWDAENNRLVGDVQYDAVAPIVDAITPVPGGVGAITTSVLAKHVVEAAERMVERHV